MGQCGCADFSCDAAFRIKGSKSVIAVQRYPGCQGCGTPAGVVLCFFNERGVRDWLDGVKIETVVPDEFGSNRGIGIGIALLGAEDLVAAAKELGDGQEIEHYSQASDFMEDAAHELIGEAVSKCKAWREWLEVRRNDA